MANSLINQYCNLHEVLPKNFKRCSGYWLVLLCLCNRANKKTLIAFPSVGKVAKEVHLSEKMARRHMRKLEADGFIKTIKNAKGGKPGETRHYKITLPDELTPWIDKLEDGVDTPLVDDFFAMVVEERKHSPTEVKTNPLGVSQTLKQPSITYRAIEDKYGKGWEFDPNKSYLVGLWIGIEARPGEANGPFVGRLKDKLNQIRNMN